MVLELFGTISIHAPVKGATMTELGQKFTDLISIHAPVKGATSNQHALLLILLISIHAPVKGATDPSGWGVQDKVFQSTPP